MNKERRLFFLTGSAALALGLVISYSKPQSQNEILITESPTSITTSVEVMSSDELENNMIQKINLARTEMGLLPLTFDPDLAKVAKIRSIESATSTPLTHYDQEGSLIFTQLLGKVQYPYALVGENLARCSPPAESAVDRCFEALMDSSEHRANILEPTFSRVAIGFTTDLNGLEVFAQIFAQPPEEAYESSIGS